MEPIWSFPWKPPPSIWVILGAAIVAVAVWMTFG